MVRKDIIQRPVLLKEAITDMRHGTEVIAVNEEGSLNLSDGTVKSKRCKAR